MTARWPLALLLTIPVPAFAQGIAADYVRANGLRTKYEGLTANVPGPATWIGTSDRFWYRRTVKGGAEFVIFDADTRQKRPAFDHQRLAASLSAATGHSYSATTLPFNGFTFADDERALEATFDGASWRCGLTDYD